MKRFWFVFAICLVLLRGPLNLYAGEASKTFFSAVSSYEAGNYDEALTGFLSVAEEENVSNGKLFYNIGNTCMQLGEIGRALLWYERAMELTPKDPDLLFNRSVALSKVKDRQEEKEGLLSSILFFWKEGLSLSLLQWGAICLGILFWGLLALALWQKRGAFKTLAVVFGAFFLLASGTALWDTATRGTQSRGVVLSPSVSIHSGLSETSTELFTLHAGSFVTIEARREGWVRIAFGSEKRGWTHAANIGEI